MISRGFGRFLAVVCRLGRVPRFRSRDTGHAAEPDRHGSRGNGRVVRVVTNALLDDAGYRVGKYVSLEQIIANSADDYYAALLASTHGCRSTGTKQDRVRGYIVNHASDIFKISDIRVALPGISDPTIRLALEALKREGQITPEGTGRSAVWRKAQGS
jgi:hypothetical protein